MQTGRFITIATNYTLQHLYMFPICVKIISCGGYIEWMIWWRVYGVANSGWAERRFTMGA